MRIAASPQSRVPIFICVTSRKTDSSCQCGVVFADAGCGLPQHYITRDGDWRAMHMPTWYGVGGSNRRSGGNRHRIGLRDMDLLDQGLRCGIVMGSLFLHNLNGLYSVCDDVHPSSSESSSSATNVAQSHQQKMMKMNSPRPPYSQNL